MKSLLVDALRQAEHDDSDSTLTDSGSFDTTVDGIVDTANDATADHVDAIDLELAKTVAGMTMAELQGIDFTQTFEPATEESAALSRPVTPVATGAEVSEYAVSRGPVWARYSPLLCATFAVIVAGAWILLQSNATPQAWIHSVRGQGNVGSTENSARVVPGSAAFPFITPETRLPADDEPAAESVQ